MVRWSEIIMRALHWGNLVKYSWLRLYQTPNNSISQHRNKWSATTSSVWAWFMNIRARSSPNPHVSRLKKIVKFQIYRRRAFCPKVRSVMKQGRIHGYPCRGGLGRGNIELGRDITFLEIEILLLIFLPSKHSKLAEQVWQSSDIRCVLATC